MVARHLRLSWVIALAILTGCGVPFEADFRVAQRKATETHRDLFVYYKSWLSPECGVMQNELARSNVQQQLGDMVCCILDEAFRPNREFMAGYGVSQYPALLVVRANGSHLIRLGALRSDEIAAFLQGAQGSASEAVAAKPAPPPGARPVSTVAAASGSTRVKWHDDFQGAYDEALRENRKLFIFYNSEIGGDDGALAAAMDRPEVARVLAGTVNCRLDWSSPANRARMAYYEVTLVPGFVALRPDGQFESRQGPLTPDELIAFVHRALP